MSAAEAADVVVMEAVMVLAAFAYNPLHRQARKMIQEGAIGQVKLARGSFSFFLDRPNDVRWDPTLGGGSLWDVGSYPVSFIRWIVGEPNQVFGWQALSDGGVDETFAGLLRYDHGVLGGFDCGFRAPFRSEAEVAGADGRCSSNGNTLSSPREADFCYGSWRGLSPGGRRGGRRRLPMRGGGSDSGCPGRRPRVDGSASSPQAQSPWRCRSKAVGRTWPPWKRSTNPRAGANRDRSLGRRSHREANERCPAPS